MLRFCFCRKFLDGTVLNNLRPLPPGFGQLDVTERGKRIQRSPGAALLILSPGSFTGPVYSNDAWVLGFKSHQKDFMVL